MMKIFFLNLVSFFICTVSFAADSAHPTNVETPKIQDDSLKMDELSILDSLIAATQKSLAEQKVIRELIISYQRTQKQYLEQSDDKETLLKLIKIAHATLEAIKESHLVQIFPQEFISDLNRFSAVATKRGVPKP